MGITQSFILAVKSIVQSKMRSFLTMLGIIIGVGSVIMIVSLGNGMTDSVNETFEGLGTETISVNLMGRGSTRSISDDEIYEFAKENSDTIRAVTPTVSVSASVKNGSESISSATVTGVGEDYLTVKSQNLKSGRFIQYIDIKYRKNVCVVGSYYDSKEVFGGSALGNEIKINGNIYKIVGVLDEITDSEDEDGSDNVVLIPYSNASKLARNAGISSYTFIAQSKDMVEEAKNTINQKLYDVYEDEDAYMILAMADMIDSVNDIMGTMVLVIACIAGISLLVGGIGIMNIMLVSVTERTREIGIRKSLGAKPRDIRGQFVIEAATTSLIGGLLGMLMGFIGANFVAKLLDMKMSVSAGSVILAVGISVGVGILFGYLPANKAAKLNPIDALRYE